MEQLNVNWDEIDELMEEIETAEEERYEYEKEKCIED